MNYGRSHDVIAGAVAESGTFGHELPQRSREVFDGHSKRWSRVTRLCKVRLIVYFDRGFYPW